MQHRPFNFRLSYSRSLNAGPFAAMLLLCMLFCGCMSKKTEGFLREVTSEEQRNGPEDVSGDTAGTAGEPEALEPVITPSLIFVDVEGAVKDPGVQILTEGSRVYQAVGAAGGFLPEAAVESVNQAQPVLDGQQIYVPTIEEITAIKQQPPAERAMILNGSKDLLDDGNTEEAGKVDLNTASKEELMSITGIGEAKAKAIIAYREAHGALRSVTELMQVEGIKEGTFEKIKNQITIR